MTITELRTALLDCPQDFDVLVEGCDCLGTANGVDVNLDKKTVCITRGEDLDGI